MTFDHDTLKEPSWWHWATTVPLLVGHFAGTAWALPAAAILCAAMLSGYLLVLGSLRPYPVQIRLGYFALLAMGALPWMGWIHASQLLGTSAMVAIGYCPLARILMLMPWNRSGKFDLALVRHAFLQSPTGGGLFRAILLAGNGDDAAPSCSLRFVAEAAAESVPTGR